MSKKNRKSANENESEEIKAGLTGSEPAGDDASTNPVGDEAQETSSEASMDELMEDVRRSLMEDEAQGSKKKSFWNRISKGKQKDQSPDAAVDTSVPVTNKPSETVPDKEKESEYLHELDELIDMLDAEVTEKKSGTAISEPDVVPEPEPEVKVDLDELKKRVFSPGAAGEMKEETEVRSVALEGGEEVFIEVEARKEDAMKERVQAFENALKPYGQYVNFMIAFLGIMLAVIAGAVMYRFYVNSRPPEPVVESNLPFPTSMVLPGGLNFNLRKGEIKNGEWNPTGPEWLTGTEVSRWVAIPWSAQMEAVVRTLTQEDTIELGMSNTDRLTYHVYSIQELTFEEMQALDQNSPSLLLVLAKQDSDKRWVVTAKP
jgi:hypothetical protein